MIDGSNIHLRLCSIPFLLLTWWSERSWGGYDRRELRRAGYSGSGHGIWVTLATSWLLKGGLAQSSLFPLLQNNITSHPSTHPSFLHLNTHDQQITRAANIRRDRKVIGASLS